VYNARFGSVTVAALCALALAAGSARASDRLARLESLERIQDWPAVERECRTLLATPLAADERIAVYKALVAATQGDARIEVLKTLPADFPDEEGVKLLVRAIRESEAYRSLDYYNLLAKRYPARLTADLVDEAARPLLNARRDWVGGAEEVVTAALTRFPNNPKLLDILAEVMRRTLRETQSLEVQRQAIANAATPELKKQMYDRLVRNLRLQKMVDEARQTQREIIRLWPDHEWARDTMDELALDCLRTQGTHEAIKVYARYAESFPKGTWTQRCYTQMPLMHQLAGQYDEAATTMQRILTQVDEKTRAGIRRQIDKLASVEGTVVDRAGRPIPEATVTLARPSPVRGETLLILAKTKADAAGRYAFRHLPSRTRYEFLAATRPDVPTTCLSTTFGPRDFSLGEGDRQVLEIREGRDPLRKLADPSPPTVTFADQMPRRLLRIFVLREWTGKAWPRAPLSYAVELPAGIKSSSLRFANSAGEMVPFQYTPGGKDGGELTFFAELPSMGTAAFFLFGGEREAPAADAASAFQVQNVAEDRQEVSTGPAAFRVPAVASKKFSLPVGARTLAAPVTAARGPDGVWRGRGHFVGNVQAEGLDAAWLETGPLRRRLRVRYAFAGGRAYEAVLTFFSGEPYVLVSEQCRSLPLSFHFSVYSGFEPDRVGLAAINRLQVQSVTSAKACRLLEMPRYVNWAPPGVGDAAGFFHSAPGKNDLITAFTVHPGDWRVQSAERWRAEVLGDRSLYCGDPQAGGRESLEVFEGRRDAGFSCPFFDGQRQWGLAITGKDNPADRAAELRNRVGEYPLDWYKDLVLDWDEEPLDSHPRLAVARSRLAESAWAVREAALAKAIFEPKQVPHFQSIVEDRPAPAMEFLLTGDPQRAWESRWGERRLADVVAGCRAGKMRAAIYSPVPVRGLPYSIADAYDAVVNSNVFGTQSCRVIRARMMFLAYALAGGDFMAWRYHAGHRNFDFSRIEVVAALALCFPTHPHAQRLVEHAVQQYRESLTAFAADESGKWEENLGCYYLWSLRTAAGMNARLLNAAWPGYDPFAWPKYQLFLRFAVRTITPQHPLNDRLCIDGLAAGQAYEQVRQGRRIPGVGDHGGEGGWPVPDGVGLSGILAARSGHPKLAAELLAAWKAGGYERDGKAGVDLKGLLAANLDPAAVEQAALTPQSSENLPQYGFCFRDDWGTPKETYLLLKCGKGGYRYHHSESSFVLYAHNRPLSLDGDENFVPARHAAVSIGPEFGYVGHGVVERHLLSPAVDYCRGVFAEKGVARSIVFAKNDYIVIRDDISGSQTSHFHLPLLVHKIQQRGDHFYCPGRLGLDVLIYPLGKSPAKTQVSTDPLLRQQLITMTRKNGDDHLNLVYWMPPGGQALEDRAGRRRLSHRGNRLRGSPFPRVRARPYGRQ